MHILFFPQMPVLQGSSIISQNLPLKPFLHWQVKLFTLSIHFPPFSHGSEIQSSAKLNKIAKLLKSWFWNWRFLAPRGVVWNIREVILKRRRKKSLRGGIYIVEEIQPWREIFEEFQPREELLGTSTKKWK